MKIGNLTVENPLFLAPMAGVTDWAFRTVCAKLGAGVTVTEMVSSRALVYQDKKTAKLLRKRITWINDFYVLEKDRILVEANARQWHILNSETLEVTEVILKKNLDTNWMPTIWERLFRERHPSEDEEPITP